MNRFAPELPEETLANSTRNIHTTLQLFGLQEQPQPYFISEGSAIVMFPEEGFRADFYIYAICMAGTASISLNGQKISIRTNDFFAAIPSTAIQVYGHSKNFKVKILLFERAFLLKNVSDTKQLEYLGFFNYDTLAHIHITRQEAALLKQKLHLLRERAKMNGIFHANIMQSLIINLLFETAEIYYRYMGLTEKKALNNEELLFMNFMSLVNAHFKEEQQLAYYADNLFISAKYLIEVCKKVAGKTPGTLIAEALLSEARLLLALPDQNISTVSAALNYSSVAAFSKFFKKHTGISPMRFKKA